MRNSPLWQVRGSGIVLVGPVKTRTRGTRLGLRSEGASPRVGTRTRSAWYLAAGVATSTCRPVGSVGAPNPRSALLVLSQVSANTEAGRNGDGLGRRAAAGHRGLLGHHLAKSSHRAYILGTRILSISQMRKLRPGEVKDRSVTITGLFWRIKEFIFIKHLEPCYSKGDCQTSTISGTWGLVGNADSQAPP